MKQRNKMPKKYFHRTTSTAPSFGNSFQAIFSKKDAEQVLSVMLEKHHDDGSTILNAYGEANQHECVAERLMLACQSQVKRQPTFMKHLYLVISKYNAEVTMRAVDMAMAWFGDVESNEANMRYWQRLINGLFARMHAKDDIILERAFNAVISNIEHYFASSFAPLVWEMCNFLIENQQFVYHVRNPSNICHFLFFCYIGLQEMEQTKGIEGIEVLDQSLALVKRICAKDASIIEPMLINRANNDHYHLARALSFCNDASNVLHKNILLQALDIVRHNISIPEYAIVELFKAFQRMNWVTNRDNARVLINYAFRQLQHDFSYHSVLEILYVIVHCNIVELALLSGCLHSKFLFTILHMPNCEFCILDSQC